VNPSPERMSDRMPTSATGQSDLSQLAVTAMQSVREEEETKQVAVGKNISSLNRLLQWGAANSERLPEDTAGAAKHVGGRRVRGPEELKKDREWLDAAFPDMFAEVKRLSAILAGRHPPGASEAEREKPVPVLDDDMRVDILTEIEEYMADLNYAVNITKLGTLAPVLEHAKHPTPRVRAAAIWVLGTAMQNVDDVKLQVVAAQGVPILVGALSDKAVAPRSKACMAVTSLLKHAEPLVLEAFRKADGPALLQFALVDDDTAIRRRVMFFLQHSPTSGNAWFPETILCNRSLTVQLVEDFSRASSDDCAFVESSSGAIRALVHQDRHRVLELAPSLPGIVENLKSKVDDDNTRSCLLELAAELSPSIP
jgi:hypothetical protein